jgi:SNF2 family DNA or RNA helicase
MSSSRLRDARDLSPGKRAEKAEVARRAADVRLPPLRYFNSSPCARHAPALDISCDDCGIGLRPHQRAGIAWMYMAGRGLLADSVGSGKTAQAAGVLAICKETGELGEHSRAVVICQAAAVLQWQRQLRRMLPGIAVSAVTGSMPRARRVDAYMAPWEIMVISDRTFASARNRDGDVELLRQFPVGTVIADDIDALRTHRTQASRAVKALAARASRRYDLNAEPLQKRVMELHSHLEMLGGNAVFGNDRAFRRNFVRTGQASFYQRAMSCRTPLPCGRPHETVVKGCKKCKTGHAWPQPAKRCPECGQQGRADPAGRTVLRTVSTDIGIRNAEEFRYLLRPWVLRRTEFGGEGYPEVQPAEIWVELTARQRERYDELRRDKLVRRWREAGEEVTHAKAAALFTRGAQICSGTAALDDGTTDDSAKLDRVMRMLTGSLEDEKVVCFVYYKPNVAALSARLDAAGIGHAVMWSNETGAELRDERIQRFTHDPACRVLVGTTTIARSLNLQAARHLVAVDTVLNPKLMTQIVGRVKRRGSAFSTVFFHQMLARGTQEEGYLPLLRREQALSDSVWEESGELFQGLSSRDMLRLVAGGPA